MSPPVCADYCNFQTGELYIDIYIYIYNDISNFCFHFILLTLFVAFFRKSHHIYVIDLMTELN